MRAYEKRIAEAVKREVGVLRAVWPDGIMPEDYAKVARMLRALKAGAVMEATKAEEDFQAAEDREALAAERLERLQHLLRTEPGTRKELAAKLEVHPRTVSRALRHLGAVVVRVLPKVPGGSRKNVYVWGLPTGKQAAEESGPK